MGGYGAYKWAFNKPNQFAAAANLSGLVSFDKPKAPAHIKFDDIFGSIDLIKGSDNDLYALLRKRIEEGTKLPRLYAACGTEDFTYDDFKEFQAFSKSIAAEITYEEGPGAHDWDFWDAYIQRVLDWMDPVK